MRRTFLLFALLLLAIGCSNEEEVGMNSSVPVPIERSGKTYSIRVEFTDGTSAEMNNMATCFHRDSCKTAVARSFWRFKFGDVIIALRMHGIDPLVKCNGAAFRTGPWEDELWFGMNLSSIKRTRINNTWYENTTLATDTLANTY